MISKCISLLFPLCFMFWGITIHSQEKKVLRKEDFSSEINDFKRSSLALLMVETPKKEHLASIKASFEEIGVPSQFNDHSLAVSFLELSDEAKDQSIAITKKLQEGQIAKKLVAKWFQRNQKGCFHLDLIKQRGLYNASTFDIQIAKSTLRGNALLEDAGEQLINNTFVIVNDHKYLNKEETASKTKQVLNSVGGLFKSKHVNTAQSLANSNAVTVLAKGYVVKTISYLYRLTWDAETATIFYGDLWVTQKDYEEDRIKAFDDSNAFRLEYIGRQEAWADVQSTTFTSKSETELIQRATVKATNAALAKLERKFEVFRTKTPLVSIDPIAAKIGTKEGLKKGDRFEVLEQLLLEDGTVEYKKVSEISIDGKQIWDNSYMPEEEPESNLEYSVFKGNAKKLYPGMLIRFKKNQSLLK